MDHEQIIHILNYLTRETDEEHGVTISNIRDYLANSAGMYDVSALTVRRDIERLETAGYQITKTIIVHAPDKSSGHRKQEVEIVFRFKVVRTSIVLDRRDYDKRKKAA